MSQQEPLQVLRRQAQVECGQHLGYLHVQLSNGTMESIAFGCTKPALHRDACAFEGVQLVVTRRRRIESW